MATTPPLVTAETNLNGKKDRKPRESKKKSNYDQVLGQVQGLDFADRVELAKELKRMIHGELSDLQTQASKFADAVKDLNL